MVYLGMDYTKGKPNFSVEKPVKIIYGNDMLDFLQDTERFTGQFKLDEHRGQLCIDENNDVSHYSYRGGAFDVDEELVETVRSFDLPRRTILDSGFLKLKKLGDKPYLYVFDILVLDGEKVWSKLEDRLSLMYNLIETKERFLVASQVKNFVKEFELLMKNESKLAEQMAKDYNIDFQLLKPLIEGFVIKDLNGVHSFPQSVKKSNNFYKLRLQDLPKGMAK